MGSVLITFLASCSRQEVKLTQYIRQGEELYLKNCSNCHQKDGNGLGLVYPPVSQSDFFDNDPAKVICLIEFGLEGELKVNGKSFNKPMPAQPALTDLEIAEITTYLYNSWGRERGIIDVSSVTSAINTCQGKD